MASPRELLDRYKPRLVVFPQDPKRHRPWNRFFERVTAARGDYQPCKAEFFLSFVYQRGKPAGWLQSFLHNPKATEPTGLAELKRLAFADLAAVRDWEIDLVPIESQNGIQAWSAYGPMLEGQAFEPAMYGRYVKGDGYHGLEYWFLFAYNDAPNKHEGDWEMIAIELDAAEQPVQAGYASHRSGLRRSWDAVKKDQGRPLVYISRGSHAAYFEHKNEGHRTNSFVVPHKGLPKFVEAAIALGVMALQSTIVFLRLHDHTPAHPNEPGDEQENRGEFIDPALVELPELDKIDETSPYWWMKLRCPWGSRHTRLLGDVAPDPPWEQKHKWDEPVAWLRNLDEDA